MKYGYMIIHPFDKVKERIAAYENIKIRGAGAAAVVFDVVTGADRERCHFRVLLGRIMAGDTLIVPRFDHLADDLLEGLRLLEVLIAAGVTVNILNMGRVDCDTIGTVATAILLEYGIFRRELSNEQRSGVDDMPLAAVRRAPMPVPIAVLPNGMPPREEGFSPVDIPCAKAAES